MNSGPGRPGAEAGFRANASIRIRNWYRCNVLLLAAVGIAVLPLAWRGASCGQDFDFHLQNWMGVVAHWRAGILYPHWAASANFGAGEPRFVFYPPLSWVLGGLLGALLPWTWVGFVFTALALLAAACSFRAMAAEWMSEEMAVLAACVYAVNPYMLFVAYERAALAELLAAVWMPLLVLYSLRKTGRAVPLALTVAALWLTDAPAAVMGLYFLAVLVVVAAIEEKRWRLVRRAAAATALGLGLSGLWLVPALYQQRWVEIWRAIGLLMRVQDSFLFGFVSLAQVPAEERFDAAYHNHLLGMASWVALALLVTTAVAAGLAWRKRRGGLWWPFVAVGAAIAVLQFRWSNVVWRIAPEMQYLQFPWRWLLVLGLVMAGLVGIAAGGSNAVRGARRLRNAAVLGLACAMAVLATAAYWQSCDEDDNVRAQVATFHDGGFTGTDEYTPRGADNDDIQPGLPPVRVLRAANGDEGPLNPDLDTWAPVPAEEIPATVQVEKWGAERRSAVVTSSGPGYAVLRLMDYPAWRVTVNGAAMNLEARRHRDDGLMVIPVKAGTTRIEVRWGTTRDAWAGRWLSLAALAVTLAWMWKERRTGRDENFR
ncbi:MAG TPA: 6-pyruvoyl-tetrahydropterin synthase-related protein [Acidobacteriaceae bacterium]|nr:6-pyruvoyl-tetrahydropterin synthase-related protein [Acidobacteriaceae bacterium]